MSVGRLLPIAVALLSLTVGVIACNTNPGETIPTPTLTTGIASAPEIPASSTASGGATATTSAFFDYPKRGYAADYSWVAGRVIFTEIQGGCVFVTLAGPPPASPTPVESGTSEGTATAGGAVVGTASRSDTSPPLREMTPQPPSAPSPEPPGDTFLPGGPAWDPSQLQDGDYVVLFGRLAGPGDPREVCPGGTPYVVEKVQLNP